MSFPYVTAFLALLVAYMVFSVWAGLDARYPIAGALVLLVATAVTDALGDSTTANTLAEYVFFLLGAGIVLLLIDHVRAGRAARRSRDPSAAAHGVAAEPSEPGEGPAHDPLDRLEEEPIPVVDALGRENEEHE